MPAKQPEAAVAPRQPHRGRDLSQRRMYDFHPQPHFTARWWREKEIGMTNILGHPDELFEPGTFSEETWLFHGDQGSDNPSLLGGATLAFWTATDMLLWLRFHALPFTIRSVNAGPEIAKAMQAIDAAVKGTDAEELLVRLAAKLRGDHGLLWIRGVESVHEWLSGCGTVEQFRQKFKDPEIECVDGEWSMSETTWAKIEQDFHYSGFEGLIFDTDENIQLED